MPSFPRATRSVPLGLLTCAFLLLGPRVASAQVPRITEEGTSIVGTVDLLVPADQVRALLADPVASARLIPDVLSVEVTSRGLCQDLGLTTRGLARPLQVRVRRCPTADGWRQDLLQSEDFTSYEMVWKIQPIESGTRVIFKAAMAVNLPVPKSLLKKGMVMSVTGTMRTLTSTVSP